MLLARISVLRSVRPMDTEDMPQSLRHGKPRLRIEVFSVVHTQCAWVGHEIQVPLTLVALQRVHKIDNGNGYVAVGIGIKDRTFCKDTGTCSDVFFGA